jgi:hypothetical protein
MSYAILSDDLLLQLEAEGLSRDARLLYLEGIVYSATALTDGRISIRLARISDADDLDAAAGELLRAGLWRKEGTHFIIDDYHHHQPKAEEVERKRADARLRAERSRRHKAGDHSMCIKGRYCPQGAEMALSHARDAHGARDVRTPTLPDPSLPKGKGKGKAKGGEAAAAASGAAASTPEERAPLHRKLVEVLPAIGAEHTFASTGSRYPVDLFDLNGKAFMLNTQSQAPFYVVSLSDAPEENWLEPLPEAIRKRVHVDADPCSASINLSGLSEPLQVLQDLHAHLLPFISSKGER